MSGAPSAVAGSTVGMASPRCRSRTSFASLVHTASPATHTTHAYLTTPSERSTLDRMEDILFWTAVVCAIASLCLWLITFIRMSKEIDAWIESFDDAQEQADRYHQQWVEARKAIAKMEGK